MFTMFQRYRRTTHECVLTISWIVFPLRRNVVNGKLQLPKIPFGIVAYVSAGPFAKQITKLELLPYSVTNWIAIFVNITPETDMINPNLL